MSTKRILGTNGTARAYKRWPEALKREIVAASFAPGASVSMIARQYDVNANQVFSWRKRYSRVAALSATPPPVPALLPVTISPEPAAVDDVAPAPCTDRCATYHAQRESAAPTSSDTIEIEVGGVYHVRVGSSFDDRALGRILDLLSRAGGVRKKARWFRFRQLLRRMGACAFGSRSGAPTCGAA